jgi:hypothetical protein
MSAPWSTRLIFRPGRIGFLAHLYTMNPFDPQWGTLMSLALCEPTLPLDDLAWSLGGVPGARLESLVPELRRGVAEVARALSGGASMTPTDLLEYLGAALYYLWEEFAARIQGIIDRNEVDVPFYDTFADTHRFLFGYPGLTVPEPAHLLPLFYQARRAWYFPASKILGRSPMAAAVRATIYRASMGGDVCTYADSLYGHMDEVPVLITGERALARTSPPSASAGRATSPSTSGRGASSGGTTRTSTSGTSARCRTS